MTAPLPADSDEQYQALQAIYLTWHDGKRPLSGFIREVQAFIAEKERVARIDELEKLEQWVSSHFLPEITIAENGDILLRIDNRINELNRKED